MPRGWRQPLLALQSAPCAVTILGVGFAPSPCSLDALCAMPRGWRQPFLALQCCTSCSHYPRRRLCSVAVLARCAVRHASLLASTASRVAVLPVCSHYPRRRLCSLAVLARCALRHASLLASTASRVAVLPVCNHYPRRRLCSVA